MKKIYYIAIVFILLITITGCSNIKTDNSPLEEFESKPLYFDFDESILSEDVVVNFDSFITVEGKEKTIEVINYLKSLNLILDDSWNITNEFYLNAYSQNNYIKDNEKYYIQFVYYNNYVYVSKINEYGIIYIDTVYRSKEKVDSNEIKHSLNKILGENNE